MHFAPARTTEPFLNYGHYGLGQIILPFFLGEKWKIEQFYEFLANYIITCENEQAFHCAPIEW